MGLFNKENTSIKLTHADFKCLVRGGVLTVVTKECEVKMILEDIGFDNMMSDIMDVKLDDKDHFVPLIRCEY